MDSVKNYFKDFPGKDKCFSTADGLIFHEKGDANLHASSLADKEVQEHVAAKYAEQKPEKKPLKKETDKKETDKKEGDKKDADNSEADKKDADKKD